MKNFVSLCSKRTLVCASVVFLLFSCTPKSWHIQLDTDNSFLPKIKVPQKETQENDLTKDLKKNLQLFFINSAGKVASTPVASLYELHENILTLTPAAPLSPDTQFMVMWQTPRRDTLTLSFRTPKFRPTDEPLVSIEQIYPLGPKIPENTLIFHALFSADVEITRDSMDYVDIFEKETKKREENWKTAALLPNIKEWQNSLPIIIYPGRVKRGLIPRETLGKVLEEGGNYTLTIDKQGFKDRFNRLISAGFEKTYTIGAPDYEMPQFLAERSIAPKSENDSLILAFSEAMDYYSIGNYISIYPKGKPEQKWQFSVTHEGNESRWKLTPNKPWLKGVPYVVSINGDVRDLAQNTLRRRFEFDSLDDLSDEPFYWAFEIN